MANQETSNKRINVVLWCLGAAAILDISFLISLMQRSVLHGAIAALLLSVETLIAVKYGSKLDEKTASFKFVTLTCASLWGIGLGSLIGLMFWSVKVFLFNGAAWFAIGFLVSAFMYHVCEKDKNSQTADRPKQGDEPTPK